MRLPSAARRVPQITRAAVILTVLALAAATASAQAASPPVAFQSTYVDKSLGGGEPFVIQSSKFGTLVYSAHEGTTHLFRDGVESPSTVCDPNANPQPKGFLCSYRNQVNIWTSTDGASWTQTQWMGSGFTNDPSKNTGFSDPSLTEDSSGVIYDTGIDLANDALFSSPDGGKSFPTGTVQCHDGDRPWLAGGQANEVFLATDTAEGSGSGHEVFHSTDAGATCSSNGITDNATNSDGSGYSGYGQIYYDRLNGALIEPAVFWGANGTWNGVGISVLANASHAWDSGSSAAFTPRQGVTGTSVQGHWPAIAIDSAGTIYVVWDTDDRAAGTSGGCNGNPTPLANSIEMISTSDLGKTWSAPVTIAHPGTRVLWPWIAAGAPGNVSVVWYQYDSVTDPDCGSGNVSVYDANVTGANTAAPQQTTVDAVGAPIHNGGICQGGTTCVATGQDRRLGDYFTNALDNRGCVIIATGDTRLVDPYTGGQLATSRPLFVRQTAGPSLTTGQDCAGPATVVPEAPLSVLLPLLGGTVVALGLLTAVGRRRRRVLVARVVGSDVE